MPSNPIQNLLRRQMGIDAFGYESGDDEVLWESWQDKPRRPEAGSPPVLRPR